MGMRTHTKFNTMLHIHAHTYTCTQSSRPFSDTENKKLLTKKHAHILAGLAMEDPHASVA